MSYADKALPCPCGKSSDAFCLNEDGTGYCFSNQCPNGKNFYSKEKLNEEYMASLGADGNYGIRASSLRPSTPATDMKNAVIAAIPDRKITLDTCKKFEVYVEPTERGISHHYYPYFDALGNYVAMKVRQLPKTFLTEGEWGKGTLFGQKLFTNGRSITVTEGELDCMAVSQMQGNKYPVVSIRTGAASAVKDCKANFPFLNQFETIVFCFDNDVAGRVAARDCAKLFPSKAKVVNLTLFKDANAYLMEGKAEQFISEWWRAEVYAADGILFGAKLAAELGKVVVKGDDMIWPTLTNIVNGVKPQELYTFLAGTGMGKTEILKELAAYFIQQGKKCGMILLEEPPHQTAQAIVGKDMNKRIHKHGVAYTPEALKTSADRMILSNLLYVHDHQGESDFQNIKEKIDYLVTGLGCDYIFLDHLTAMAEGKEGEDGNVNSRIHYMMDVINKMLMAKQFTMFLISHIRKAQGKAAEEGGHITMDDAYGSGAIKQRSHYVFSFEGNQQAPSHFERNIRYLRCLKDRPLGEGTGKHVTLFYDHANGRLSEYDGDVVYGPETKTREELEGVEHE